MNNRQRDDESRRLDELVRHLRPAPAEGDRVSVSEALASLLTSKRSSERPASEISEPAQAKI